MGVADRLRAIGPGAMVAAAFIGPGTVTTASVTGAQFGYALIWTILFSIIATIVLQEMSARLGLVSREGLGEALRSRFDDVGAKYVLVVGVIFSGLGYEPIRAIVFAQVVNGILLPIVALFLIYVMNDRDISGDFTNDVVQNVRGGLVTLVVVWLGLRTLLSVAGVRP